ncbi:MAG: potassium channel protein [Planctomycetota bacterium]
MTVSPPRFRPTAHPFPRYMSLLVRVRRGLHFLALFTAVAVVGHMLMTGEGLLDSVYFVVITVSTVGYGETSQADAATKLFTIATIVVGVGAVGYIGTLLVQAMVEGEIRQALGIERMTNEIKQLSGHAIICGYGRIGQILADELRRRGKSFVIVDQDPDVVAAASDDRELVVSGDATAEETLLDAGIERAKTLIVALASDADNVFLTLTARNLNGDLRIIARGEQRATEKKLRQAGASEVVLPAVIGARRMAAMVTRPHAAAMLDHFTDHEKLDAELEEFTIPEASGLVNRTVRETAARQRHHLLVVGIRRSDGALLFNPDPDASFQAGDTLVVMGKREDVEAFRAVHGCAEANA